MQYATALTPARIISRGASRACATRRRPRADTVARLAMTILVVSALLVSVLSLVLQPYAPQPLAWGAIVTGDATTVWDIAEAHPVAGLSTADTVDLICAENGLSGGTIHPGQVLQVPGLPAAVSVALN